MSNLHTKSQLSECVSILQIYQNLDGQIDQKTTELEIVNNDWQEATSRKLSATSEVLKGFDERRTKCSNTSKAKTKN